MTDTSLSGRYRLLECIALGGMGEVWRAADDVLGRDVAVKVLRPEYARNAEFGERFHAEARHTALLSHRGIAQVYDFGDDDGSPYLVMELVPGDPLSALLSRHGRLDAAHTLAIVEQVGFALQAAHDAGLVHRDVKPGNLLVTPDGHVKVTDFGIARAADTVALTRTGAVMGTAHYLSPEQALGEQATPLSDVYCLGLVAYECLAGRRPFTEGGPVAVALAHAHTAPPPLPDDVPAAVAALVGETLAKDRAQRPHSARELAAAAADLRRGLTGVERTGSGAPVLTPSASAVLASAWSAPSSGPATGQLASPPGAGPSVRSPRHAGLAGPVPTRAEQGLGRRTKHAVVAAATVVVLAGVGTVASLAWRTADQPGSQPDAAPTTAGSPAGTVLVAAEDYIGRPYPEAAAALNALGMQVRSVTVAGEGQAGTVSDLTPTGQVPAGSTVTLTVIRPAQEATSPTDSGVAVSDPTPAPGSGSPSGVSDQSAQRAGSDDEAGGGGEAADGSDDAEAGAEPATGSGPTSLVQQPSSGEGSASTSSNSSDSSGGTRPGGSTDSGSTDSGSTDSGSTDSGSTDNDSTDGQPQDGSGTTDPAEGDGPSAEPADPDGGSPPPAPDDPGQPTQPDGDDAPAEPGNGNGGGNGGNDAKPGTGKDGAKPDKPDKPDKGKPAQPGNGNGNGNRPGATGSAGAARGASAAPPGRGGRAEPPAQGVDRRAGAAAAAKDQSTNATSNKQRGRGKGDR